MSEKFLCLMATFDEKSSKKINDLMEKIKETGIQGKQTPDLPPHITLASFDRSRESEVLERIQQVAAETDSFQLPFNHIGLFGLKVLFLAPDVNHELLDLHSQFDGLSLKSDRGWTAHATVLIDEPDPIQRALPLIAQEFKHINARVEALRLYEFFPTRLIGEFELKKSHPWKE